MVPDKFNMVDMGGIDLVMMQGEEIPGLYERLVESITLCRYQCLYNWMFDGVQIPPTYVQMTIDSDNRNVKINEGVEVDDEDVIHIYSLEIEPHLVNISITENGVFEPTEGIDGFKIITVDVPPVVPVLESLSVTENGTYLPGEGVDGFNQVIVDVSTSAFVEDEYSQLFTDYFDTGVNINDSYRLEVCFFVTEYVNDGHIIGQHSNSSGSAFHLTTFSNKWYCGGGSTEYNFQPAAEYPLYGADIICSMAKNDVKMNGIQVLSDYNLITQTIPYCLNARGASVSTNGKYKYKYVKVYDSNDDLICDWRFGHLDLNNITFYLAHDLISNLYKSYN